VSKALLMSILVATIALPANLARDPRPLRGLQRTLFWMAAFEVLYVLALVFVYPRLM
jgi:hypothetical protein